jgi:hypothetical protein
MRVLFYPQFPTMEGYTLVSLLHELGYQGVSRLDDPFDLAVAWEDSTWLAPQPALAAVAARVPVWNLDCRDISKRRVDEVSREVFGYGAEVDPTTHRGPCAMKTDENARGRGFVVLAPIERVEPGFVYQRFIACTENGRTVNYRVPVIAGAIPLCYVLERAPIDAHLKTDAVACRLVETDDLLSRDEQAQILRLCDRMGLDFGELDVLRDDDDGRIYVIDVNKTPAGMGIAYRHRWTAEQRRTALRRLADAFAAAVRAGRPRRRAPA